MAYQELGFTVENQALPEQFLQQLEAAIFKPLALQAKFVLGREFDINAPLPVRQAAMVELKQKAPDRYLAALKISQLHPALMGAASQPSIVSALCKIGLKTPIVALKPYPILLSPALFIENGYNVRPAHQEWPVMQGSHNAVVVWFPLHDVGPDHSTLEIYPRSHLNGVLPYEVSRCGSRIKDGVLDMEPVKLVLRRRDFVIFSAFTAHRSSLNGSSLRAAVSVRFNDLAAPSFVSRGFPDTTTFKISREPLDGIAHFFQAEG